MPRKLPTQSQLDQIAEAAKARARLSIPNDNPLRCPVLVELIDNREMDILAIITHWDIHYHLELNSRQYNTNIERQAR